MSCFANFDTTCSHFNIVDDYLNGCEVCTDCGLVMHDRIYAPCYNRLEPIEAEKRSEYAACDKNNFPDETMQRVCNKCNIECADLKRAVFKKWYASVKSRKKGVCLESLALMCVYTALIESEVPRPMKDLCSMTGIKEDKVWQYVKNDDSFYSPNLMCEYFLHSLNLSYKELREIREKVKHHEKRFVFSAKTLIAACTHIFLRDRASRADREKPKSLVHLAKQLGVSPMALSRCVKKIENH